MYICNSANSMIITLIKEQKNEWKSGLIFVFQNWNKKKIFNEQKS